MKVFRRMMVRPSERWKVLTFHLSIDLTLELRLSLEREAFRVHIHATLPNCSSLMRYSIFNKIYKSNNINFNLVIVIDLDTFKFK